MPDDDGSEWTAEIDALLDAYALKDERRTGWQLRGVTDPETVAGHTWGVAYLCLLFADRAGVDADRALRLAVLHDVAEAEVGDLPTRVADADQPVDADEKERRERRAIADLLDPFEDDLRADWEAYEARETPEARFVKDADLLDVCLQALYYEREGRYDGDDDRSEFEAYDDLDEFFATAEPRLTTGFGRSLFEAVQARYEAAKAAKTED